MSKRKITYAAAIAVCAMLGVSPVYADTPSADAASTSASTSTSAGIDVAQNNILHIRTGYEFEDGSMDVWNEGTCFLISDTYALTDKDLVYVTKDSPLYKKIREERNGIYQLNGIDLSDYNALQKNVKTYVTSADGEEIPVSIDVKANSENLDYAAVKLSTPAEYTTSVFEGADLPKDGEEIYVYGYREDDLNGESLLTPEAVTEETKKVADSSDSLFSYEGTSDEGATGGPVYNEDGNIIGINTEPVNGKGDVIPFSAIRPLLDGAGITYVAQNVGKAEEASGEIDKSKLNEAIEEAKGIDRASCTEESLSALDAARENAETVAADKLSTQEDVDKAQEELAGALSSMEQKGLPKLPVKLIAFLAIFAVGVAAAIFVLIRSLFGGRKKQPEAKKQAGGKTPAFGKKAGGTVAKKKGFRIPVPRKNAASFNRQADDDREQLQAMYEKANGSFYASDRYAAGYGDDGYEDDGEAETSVLSRKSDERHPYLVNRQTGERVDLTKPFLVVGKERKTVDYCISKPEVSREHCHILVHGTDIRIEDRNSTNGTFINGRRLKPGVKVGLADKDILAIADVEFEVHLD